MVGVISEEVGEIDRGRRAAQTGRRLGSSIKRHGVDLSAVSEQKCMISFECVFIFSSILGMCII